MRQLTFLALGLATFASVASAQGTQPPTRLPAARVIGDTMNIVTVQNDRASAVTVYMENGAFDRRIGVVDAGKTATLPLPAWAVTGRRTLSLFARADGESGDLVTQSFELRGANRIGLLVPPSGGIADCDSLPVTLTSEELASTTLTVENQRTKPMTVYAEQGTYSIRLGEVKPGDKTTLRFPASIVRKDNTIRVFVRPAGSIDLSTQALALKRGEHIAMVITR